VSTLRALWQLARPRQWTKNLVVFAGLLFSANLLHLDLLFRTVQAFLVFCLAASAVYVFNDLYDRESDRHHPVKSKRPLAAGSIPVETASLAAALALALALGWAFWLARDLGLAVTAYVLLNLAYTLGLKRVVILDVFVISSGFVLRAAGGALAIAVTISPWLLVVASLLSLFLGFAKRRHELVSLGAAATLHRPSLEEYSAPLLDQFLNVLAAATIIGYSLYAFTSSTAQQYHNLMLTVPFVIYGVLRYLFLVAQRNLGGSPELVLLKDPPMLTTILLWAATAAFILHRA
jgi:4-hydroxybenzoate polyprenyltransferase